MTQSSILVVYVFLVVSVVCQRMQAQSAPTWTYEVNKNITTIGRHYLEEDYQGNLYFGGKATNPILLPFLFRFTANGVLAREYYDITPFLPSFGGCRIMEDSTLVVSLNGADGQIVTKYAAPDDTLWHRVHHRGVIFYDNVFTTDASGNAYTAVNINDTLILVSKLDLEGDNGWEVEVPLSNFYFPQIVAYTNDTLRVNLSSSEWLLFSADGDFYGVRPFIYPPFTGTASIHLVVPDGGMVVGQLFRGYRAYRTDSYGNILWEYFKPATVPQNLSIDRTLYYGIDDAYNIYILGMYQNTSGNVETLLTKLSLDGEMLWERAIGSQFGASSYSVFANDMFVTDGKIIVCMSFSYPGDSDALTVVFDSDGNEILTTRYNSGRPGTKRAIKAKIANDGGLVIVGSAGQDYAFVQKFELPPVNSTSNELTKTKPFILGNNPARDILQLYPSGTTSPPHLFYQLVNQLGVVCKSGEIDELPVFITVQDIPTGFYWLRVHNKRTSWVSSVSIH